MSLIKLENINKIYGEKSARVHALKDINLSVESSELISIMGKSGCGKSTLLNVLGSITAPSSGNYYFEGEDIGHLKPNQAALFRGRNIGFVVQHFALIPDLTVSRNIALPMVYQKQPNNVIHRKVSAILKEMGLSDKADKYPRELSGGECQRVAIARAIVTNPKILLADEPTGALDEATGAMIMDIFRQLNDAGMTIIIVTHDPDIAAKCKRQITMRDGQIVN